MKARRTETAIKHLHRHSFLAVAIALLPGACAPAYQAPPVSAPLVAASLQPASTLERGYQIHQVKCAKCHPFENPAHYDEIELKEEIMPVMARKSNLDRADGDAVLAYLLAARKLP
jgi:mono/diheme cytochrome c family protein